MTPEQRTQDGHDAGRSWALLPRAAAAIIAVAAGAAHPARAACTDEICNTFTSSTTTGVGTSLAGAAQAVAQIFASQSFRTLFDFYGGQRSFATGGTTVTTQIFETFGGPITIPIGSNVATCNGPPTQWPPGANCTINPGASLLTVKAGELNINTNIHTEIQSTLSNENPLFGFVLGDFHTAFQSALLEQNSGFLDALFAQFRGFGVTGAGPAGAVPGAGLNTQFASLGAPDERGVNLAQAGPDGRMRPSPWFVWLRPMGSLGRVDGSNERLGFRYDTAGFAGGLEYRWNGPWIAGATLGYAHTSVTQATTNDKGSIDSLQIGAYGGYRGERLHVVAAALFQQNWIGTERFTALAPTIATASYTAQAYSVGVEAGHKYPVMGAVIQPLASLVFTHVRQGGFSENGATLLEIAGQSSAVNALKVSLGVRLWRDFVVFGTKLTPEFRARWVQDLLNDRRAITARFLGDPAQTAFTVNGAKPTPAAAVIGAGMTLGSGSNVKLSFAYDAEFRANARNHTVQAQLKLRW